MKKIITCIILMFFLISCHADETHISSELDYMGEKIVVEVTIKEVSNSSNDLNNRAIIFGDIQAEGFSESIKYFDLEKIKLVVDGVSNESVYVDSIASFNSKKLEIVNGYLKTPVYWVFPKDSINLMQKNQEISLQVSE